MCVSWTGIDCKLALVGNTSVVTGYDSFEQEISCHLKKTAILGG